MFFKDIDLWGKKKLALVTLICGIFYLVFASIIPVVIITQKYDLFKEATFKASFVGICVIVFVCTVVVTSIKYVVGIMPEVKRGQQIRKFGLMMIGHLLIPAAIIWVTYLIMRNLEIAVYCIRGACYSYFGAIVVQYTCLETLKVQWQFESKVDAREKEAAISRGRERHF